MNLSGTITDGGDTSARTIKLAERVARQIIFEIRDRGWPVGEVLGTEVELIERYKVSRAILSEAIRQVEMQGAAYMQRGPRGGLTVAALAPEAIVKTIANYLEFVDVSLHELFEALQIIEVHSVVGAARYATPDDIVNLRKLVAEIDESTSQQDYQRRLMAVRLGIADVCGNPAIALFLRILVRALTHLVWRFAPVVESTSPAMMALRANIAELVEAIANADGARAEQIIRRYLGTTNEAVDKLVSERRQALSARVNDRLNGKEQQTGPAKTADRVARAILDDVRHGKLQFGEKIGQENELMRRHGVSRWVIRQSIRMLEVHSVIRAKRGQGGGLTVAEPSPDYAVSTAETYLAAIDIGPDPFAELWFSLLTNVAQLAAERSQPGSTDALGDYSERVQTLSFEELREGLPRCYFLLAQIADNRVFDLILRIIANYLMNFKVRVSSPNWTNNMICLLPEISSAVAENDPDRARELMLNYVSMIRTYMRFVPVLTPEAKQRALAGH